MLEKLWEKEKLLCTRNFSSHSVFKRLILQTCNNNGLFGKGLNGQFLSAIITCDIYFITLVDSCSAPDDVCVAFTLWQNRRLIYIEGISRWQRFSNDGSFHQISRKHCGDRRRCWWLEFSSFPTMLSKDFFLRVVKLRSVWKRFNPFQHNDTFWRPWKTSLLKNNVGKGEIACNEQFLLFPQCFLLVWITFCHFRQIWNCRLQTLSVWMILKFVVW